MKHLVRKIRKLTEQRGIFEDLLKDMTFYNKHVEGMFRGEIFEHLIEVVRRKLRHDGGS